VRYKGERNTFKNLCMPLTLFKPGCGRGADLPLTRGMLRNPKGLLLAFIKRKTKRGEVLLFFFSNYGWKGSYAYFAHNIFAVGTIVKQRGDVLYNLNIHLSPYQREKGLVYFHFNYAGYI